MAGRRLDPEEAALWARVRASVRPLPRQTGTAPAIHPELVEGRATKAAASTTRPSTSSGRTVEKAAIAAATRQRPPSNTLDGSWDRQIVRGAIVPDSTLDLHGHTLRSAHAMLDTGLDRAIQRGDRVMLLVTGKPPRETSERPHQRGAIRAAIGDWIAASRHAGRIAAIRGAHPRHGGQGALYLVFRRPRTTSP